MKANTFNNKSSNQTKEPLIEAFINFHRRLFDWASNVKEFKLKELRYKLKHLSDEVKGNYDLTTRRYLRKPLKSLIKRILNVALQVESNNRINADRFLEAYFGGTMIRFDDSSSKSYDVVVFRRTNSINVWIFKDEPYPNELPDSHKIEASRVALDAEKEFSKSCERVKIIYRNGEVNFDFNKHSRSLTTLGSPVGTPINSPREEKGNNIKDDYYGWIEQGQKYPLKLELLPKKNQICGYIREAHATNVQPGDILVVEGGNNTRIFCKCVKIVAFNKCVRALTKGAEEFVIPIVLNPFYEISDDYKGPVRVGDMDKWKFRPPTDEELSILFNLPSKGLAIGSVIHSCARNLTYYYPEDPEVIYESIFITGVQRSGKTNTIKMLIRVMVSLASAPAIVVIDGEGDYTNFIERDKLPSQSKDFLERHGIGDVKPEVIKISNDPSKSDVCFTLTGILPEDLVYLIPEIPQKSVEIIQSIIEKYCQEKELLNINLPDLKEYVINEVRNSQLIHRSQKGSIIRALQFSRNLRLMDQPGVKPLQPSDFLTPGKITVIDVSDLDDDQKRSVALYLLLMFDKFKMNAPTREPGLILVLDEAHRLFPRERAGVNKEYTKRIAERVSNILHRGRKRKFGAIIATQSPIDVHPLIAELPNTKIVHHLEGQESWIRSSLGKEFVEEVKNLNTGEAFISLRGTGLNIATLKIKVPNVSDQV